MLNGNPAQAQATQRHAVIHVHLEQLLETNLDESE
jgi:hypothetical protein